MNMNTHNKVCNLSQPHLKMLKDFLIMKFLLLLHVYTSAFQNVYMNLTNYKQVVEKEKFTN